MRRLDVLEVAQVPAADVAFVGRHAADVVGVLAARGRRSGCSSARRISSACSWSTQNTMVLAKRSVLLQELGQVAGDRLGAGPQRDDPLEVPGLVLLVRDLAAVAVELALARAPAGGVPGR